MKKPTTNKKLEEKIPPHPERLKPRTLEVFNMKLRKTLTARDVEHMEAENLKSKRLKEALDFEALATHRTQNNTRIWQQRAKLDEQARKAGSFEKWAAGIMKEAAEKAAAKTRREFEEKEKPQ